MSAQDRVFLALQPDLQAEIQSFWESEYAGQCESEIERIFAAVALVADRMHGGGNFHPTREAAANKMFLEPQYEIGPYRVDFLLGFGKTARDLQKCIVVECDGHEFHERTKKQAARDKSRDRYLSSQVGKVLRFTGSELYRDPAGCLIEAVKILAVLNGLARS